MSNQLLTEIRCDVCKGTKQHPRLPHVTCGACQGTGLSCHPYDQPRNGTTVGRAVGESLPAHMTVHTVFGRDRKGYYREQEGETVTDRCTGEVRIVGILVSWPNPEYEKRLELDRQGLLYP